MVTTKRKLEDRLNRLLLRADDYLVKSFNPRELVARVRAVLLRSNQDSSSAKKIVLGGRRTKSIPGAKK